MASHLHNQRILRFLLVLSVVVLTIFVYASYSTNSSAYTPATHLRNIPSAAEALRNRQNHTAFNEIEDSKSAGIGIRAAPNDLNEAQQQQQQPQQQQPHQKYVKVMGKVIASGDSELANFAKKQQKLHREPTIDDVAVADSGGSGSSNGLDDVADDEHFVNNDLLEEQYAQNIDNTLENYNISNAAAGNAPAQLHNQNAQKQEQVPDDQSPNQVASNSKNHNNENVGNNINNLNKILDSDVLIPTSNLQKFIENADKILKNMTVINAYPSDAANGGVADAKIPILQIDMGNNMDNNILDNSIESNEALPPSVVMTIKRPNGGVAPNVANNNNEEEHKIKESKPVAKVVPNNVVKDIKLSSNTTTSRLTYNTSKGILTEQIYESGHLNNEINIEKLCPKVGADIKLLILITSAPSHAEARLAIRQTWGHYGTRRDVSIAFMLGRTVNETLNKALTQENFIYGDLIRGNFIDSYNNLTLKTVSSLEWVDQHCSSAKYLLKTDDDMFINVPKLFTFLDSHTKDKHVIYGRLAKKWKPIRNKKSKYYVSTDQFAAPIFPPFTTGPAYVMSQDSIHQLYVRSLKEVYLKLEDVFTTGVVAEQLGIKRIHVNEFLNRRIAFNPCNIRKTISVHMIKPNEQFDLWKKLLDQTTKCK